MNVSEARLIANRQNAAKSTGPKTPEGKERSRQNRLKHGMAGEGVVLPASDLAEVENRVETLHAELSPRSAIGSILVRQLATLSVKMERGAKQEFAGVAFRVRHAVEVFDQERQDRVEAIFGSIGQEPGKAVELLKKSPEGIALLLKAWHDLRNDLSRAINPEWSPTRLEKMANLMGLTRQAINKTRLEALSGVYWGYLGGLEEHERVGFDPQSRQTWARLAIIEQVDPEIARLEAHLESLDTAMIEQDRREASDRALFDPSKEATLARRYESEARRHFFKALNEFRQAEAEFSDREAELESAKVASIGENPPTTDREPRPRPETAPRDQDRPVREVPLGEIRPNSRDMKVKSVALAAR
jgi:hypothetical protein